MLGVTDDLVPASQAQLLLDDYISSKYHHVLAPDDLDRSSQFRFVPFPHFEQTSKRVDGYWVKLRFVLSMSVTALLGMQTDQCAETT